MHCVQMVPSELFEMPHLSVLLMRNNPLKVIGSDVEKLQHLHTVAFSFCQLTSLPSEYESASVLMIYHQSFTVYVMSHDHIQHKNGKGLRII